MSRPLDVDLTFVVVANSFVYTSGPELRSDIESLNSHQTRWRDKNLRAKNAYLSLAPSDCSVKASFNEVLIAVCNYISLEEARSVLGEFAAL